MSSKSFLELVGPKKAAIALVLIVLASVGLDQATKSHSEKFLKTWSHDTEIDLYKGQRQRVVGLGDEFGPGSYVSINLNYVRNQGAAWGALANMGERYRIPFFMGVTAVAVFVLFLFFRSTPPSHRLARYGLALILSGAVGNFIDRIRLGYVVDWVDIHWRILSWQYYFPNFNIADIAITLGVGSLLVDMVVSDIRRLTSQNKAQLQSDTGAKPGP